MLAQPWLCTACQGALSQGVSGVRVLHVRVSEVS